MLRPSPTSTLFPYTTLFRSGFHLHAAAWRDRAVPKPLHQRTARSLGRRHPGLGRGQAARARDRKSTRLNSSHLVISYAVFYLKKKKMISNQKRKILNARTTY